MLLEAGAATMINRNGDGYFDGGGELSEGGCGGRGGSCKLGFGRRDGERVKVAPEKVVLLMVGSTAVMVEGRSL